MGKHDSSLTRVQPVFKALYELDATGESWIGRFLKMGSLYDSSEGVASVGPLTSPPKFEFSAHPPKSFLCWLLQNPDQLTRPPDKYWKKWGQKTQDKREALLAGDMATQSEGLRQLQERVKLPNRAWWRIEGPTKVDCALITSTAVIFIEGKRTETGASKDVLWYQHRNQAIRNLDCAAEYAQSHTLPSFYVILVVEKDLFRYSLDAKTIAQSLPHRAEAERDILMKHYLGITTWQDIVARFELDPTILVKEL